MTPHAPHDGGSTPGEPPFSFGGAPLAWVDPGRDEATSTAVIDLVATVSDTPVEELPSLYSVIDPDVLDTIFDQSQGGEVTFLYNGYGVRVSAGRRVSVYPVPSNTVRPVGGEPGPDSRLGGLDTKRRADAVLDGTAGGRDVRFQLLVESIEDYAVFMLDTEGNVVSWNPGARNIKGYREDEILGRHFSVFYPDEDVEDGVPARNLNDARAEGRIEDEGWRVRKDGSRFYANVTISAIRDESGSLRGFAKVTRDMTTEHRHRETERRKERLEEFSNVVAHDLRNPLNVALTHLDLLETGDDDHRETIREALVRMDEIIEDLLTLARHGETVAPDGVVDLAAVAEDAWSIVSSSHEGASAALEVEASIAFVADRSKLQELLENLLANAIEHGGDGTDVRIGDLSGEPGFYVEDDGPGIPEDEQDRVFEPGYSTTEGGTGFGLGIVERIAEAHGWAVRITEGEAGGTRVEIIGVEPAEG